MKSVKDLLFPTKNKDTDIYPAKQVTGDRSGQGPAGTSVAFEYRDPGNTSIVCYEKDVLYNQPGDEIIFARRTAGTRGNTPETESGFTYGRDKDSVTVYFEDVAGQGYCIVDGLLFCVAEKQIVDLSKLYEETGKSIPSIKVGQEQGTFPAGKGKTINIGKVKSVLLPSLDVGDKSLQIGDKRLDMGGDAIKMMFGVEAIMQQNTGANTIPPIMTARLLAQQFNQQNGR
jgi:hypothetical protein